MIRYYLFIYFYHVAKTIIIYKKMIAKFGYNQLV
jgi:hypothetical protein